MSAAAPAARSVRARPAGLATTLSVALLLVGCATPKCDTCGQPPTCSVADQSTPPKTLASLVCAYQTADCLGYAALLADDFRFVFDPDLVDESPGEWGPAADSTAACNLFLDPLVTSIRIELAFAVDTPVTIPGREAWRQIRVADTYLAIDRETGGGGEPFTYLIDGDQQDFFFRRGRAPGDTLAGSPTAQKWFIVEWRDLAAHGAPGRPGPGRVSAPAVEPATWSRLKLIYAQ